ncbi:MAG: hypothetical protein ACOX9R_01155 [Armatimonadota bacterium]|jgi:hypothetical protein
MNARGAWFRRGARATCVLALVVVVAAVAAAEDGPQLPATRVAVFPLTDPVDLPDRMIGRRAGDALHVALAAHETWELVDSGWLLRLCEVEGARAPFAVGYLQMLGQSARAPLAVAGTVEVCQINSVRGIAQVTLVVELVETLGGERLASARGVASAKRAEGEAIDQVIDRALTEAAADAARDLTSFDPMMAIVIARLPDGRVMMDGPQEPRIREGSKLLVFRGERVVGTVEVKTSRLTVLHAEPITGDDFRQGDRAVLVAR